MVASGTVAALAGALYAGTTGGADPTSGSAFLCGVRSRVPRSDEHHPRTVQCLGSLHGGVFLVTGITGLQLLGVQSYVQQLFYGGALVIAVAISQVARRRRARTDF